MKGYCPNCKKPTAGHTDQESAKCVIELAEKYPENKELQEAAKVSRAAFLMQQMFEEGKVFEAVSLMKKISDKINADIDDPPGWQDNVPEN